MEETAGIAQEFDWSNLLIFVGGIVGYILSEGRQLIRIKREQARKEVTLDMRVSNIDGRVLKLENDMKEGLARLEEKIETKNQNVSNKIDNLGKKVDIKFDMLTKQIMNLLQTGNFVKKTP